MAPLEKRQRCYRNVFGQVYCESSNWHRWGRWVVLGILIFVGLLLIGLIVRNRRRARRNVRPYHGTGWMMWPMNRPPQNPQYQVPPYAAPPPAYPYATGQPHDGPSAADGTYYPPNQAGGVAEPKPPHYGPNSNNAYAPGPAGYASPPPQYGGGATYAPPPGPPPPLPARV